MTKPEDEVPKTSGRDGAEGEFRGSDQGPDRSERGEEETLLRSFRAPRGDGEIVRPDDETRVSAVDETTMGLPPGSSEETAEDLGPYRLVQELGRGGQGMVYLAEDSRLGRKVALKLLSSLALSSNMGLQRFRREAEAASRLDDPGICTVYETGEIRGLPYIAMQYVEGETLAARIRATASSDATAATPDSTDSATSRSRAGLDAWVQIIEKAARSLHAAHEAGLVHRDIKPANIMITRDDRPVILDFGLARADDFESQGLTRTGDVLGTPAYMAPEQVSGDAHAVDRRSDVYALGVSLYECLTGQRPHSAPTREALYRQIVEGQVVPASRFNSLVTRDLDVIIQTATDRDANRRYQSAKALADDLKRFLNREPIAARPAGPLLRIWRWGERNPALATSLSLLFLFLSIGLAVVTSLWQKSETALEVARREQERADAKTREAQANLRDFEMLSDLQRFDDYIVEIEQLYPPRPAQLPVIDAWLAKTQDLIAGRSLHEERLRALQERSRVLDLDEIIATQPDANVSVLLDLDRRRGRLLARLQSPKISAEERERHESLARQLEDRRRSLVAMILADHRHHFDDVAQAWKHLNLERLIRSIEILDRPVASPLAEVRFLRRQCLEIAPASVEGEARELWVETLARIRAPGSPYDGLVMDPQLGLRPLGPDPDSGLEEFAQVLSGRIPERDESGRLQITADAAIVFVLLPGADTTIQFDTADVPQENPGPRPVKLDPCFLAKYELSISQWEMATNDILRTPAGVDDVSEEEYENTGRIPVGNIPWETAVRYMHRLGLQLPTEAQWEYAARAGLRGTWPGGEDPESVYGLGNLAPVDHPAAANDVFEYLAPIGAFPPNAFGLHDMLGNVWELTRDGLDVDSVPMMMGDGLHSLGGEDSYVIRGGSYRNGPDTVRFNIRASIDRASSTRSVGLRPLRPILSEGE